MLYNGCVNNNACNNNCGCNNTATSTVSGCATDSCVNNCASCSNIGGNWISCIINLVVIIVVLQFLCQIIGGLSCDGNNCCCC